MACTARTPTAPFNTPLRMLSARATANGVAMSSDAAIAVASIFCFVMHCHSVCDYRKRVLVLEKRYEEPLQFPRARLSARIMRTSEAVYANLREFVERLRHDGELREISVRVDPHLEIAEIADRCVKSDGGGPALLFTDVKGSRFPVLINALATERRMARA